MLHFTYIACVGVCVSVCLCILNKIKSMWFSKFIWCKLDVNVKMCVYHFKSNQGNVWNAKRKFHYHNTHRINVETYLEKKCRMVTILAFHRSPICFCLCSHERPTTCCIINVHVKISRREILHIRYLKFYIIFQQVAYRLSALH